MRKQTILFFLINILWIQAQPSYKNVWTTYAKKIEAGSQSEISDSASLLNYKTTTSTISSNKTSGNNVITVKRTVQ